MVFDVLWPPMLPQDCHSVMLPKVLDPKTEIKPDNPNSKKKLAKVRNLNVPSCFEEFKTGVNSDKFHNVIDKVEPPLGEAQWEG